MAACHLVADTDFTFFGYIDLGNLHDAGRQLVTYRNVEFLAAQLGINLLRFTQIVHDKLTHKFVCMLVASPHAEVHGVEINILERPGGKLATLGNNIRSEEILNTLRGLARSKGHKLADQKILQVAELFFILFVELGQKCLCGLVLTSALGGSREKVAADYHTLERG